MEGQSSDVGDIHEHEPVRHPSAADRIRPRPDSFLIACRVFSIITSLSAILCLTVNVISAVQSFKKLSDIFDGIFRCYAVVIAVFVVVAETEWEFVMKFSKVLEYWVGRGMLQIFVAVMTRAYPAYLRDHQNLFLLQSISSYLLIACGLIYIVSGILCIGVVKRSRQSKEMSREQAKKNLEDLEKRREELESLLLESGV